jgi:cell division protein FtsW (lipid II flippase)
MSLAPAKFHEPARMCVCACARAYVCACACVSINLVQKLLGTLSLYVPTTLMLSFWNGSTVLIPFRITIPFYAHLIYLQSSCSPATLTQITLQVAFPKLHQPQELDPFPTYGKCSFQGA